MLDSGFLDEQTRTLTLIVTYTCTAACTECCFGCTPRTQGRLSKEEISAAINEAKRDFPGLEVVVFTGGECFLLKNDLFESIALATSLNLKTRCVTNASWGKSKNSAEQTVRQLIEAGISEINISTGKDHQEFVPLESVLNAAEALVFSNVFTLITIEQDTPESDCRTAITNSPRIQHLLEKYPHKFRLQTNTWMPFTHDAEVRKTPLKSTNISGPCTQVFSNLVLTPHNMVSACCGLTLEHIPEMKLGKSEPNKLREIYSQQLDDFLKIWLHTEGPAEILRSVMDEKEVDILINESNHICQLCSYLHLNTEIRERIKAEWIKHVPRVMHQLSVERLARSLRVPLSEVVNTQ